MSKIKAFICDYKHHLVLEDEAVGVLVRPDMFAAGGERYSLVNNPDKAEIHCCLDCYRTYVTTPANNLTNRRKDGEEAYKLKIKELTHGLASITVKNFRLKQK